MEYVCIADSVGLQRRSVSCSHDRRMLTDLTPHPGVSTGLSIQCVLGKIAVCEAHYIAIM